MNRNIKDTEVCEIGTINDLRNKISSLIQIDNFKFFQKT
jgi:hypothetical protein